MESQVVQLPLVERVKKVALGWVFSSVLWVFVVNYDSLKDPYSSLFGSWYSKPRL